MSQTQVHSNIINHLERCLQSNSDMLRELILHDSPVDALVTTEAINKHLSLGRRRSFLAVMIAHNHGKSSLGRYNRDLALLYKDKIHSESGATLTVEEIH